MSKNVTPLRSPAKPHKARAATTVPANAVSVRLNTMCEMLGISKSKGVKLIEQGAVRSTKIGRTRLISVQSIHELVNGEAA